MLHLALLKRNERTTAKHKVLAKLTQVLVARALSILARSAAGDLGLRGLFSCSCAQTASHTPLTQIPQLQHTHTERSI